MDENHLRAELRHWYNQFINGAKELNKNKSIYPIYGLLDGVLNASSIIKSYFDIKYNQDIQAVSVDAMHEWMKTNTGITTVIIESTVLATLSTLGNLFTENDPALYQKNIFFTWKYSRELIQAARNAFKAIRTTILTTDMTVLKAIILPCSMIFGSLYVISRMCFLEIQKSRNNMIKTNDSANQNLLAILGLQDIDDAVIHSLNNATPQTIPWYWRNLYLLLKAFNGLIDSLYLFIGIITLTTLGTQTFFYATVISIFYCAVCIATRAYEEYEQQNRLMMSELSLNLTKEAIRLKYHFFKLHQLSVHSATHHDVTIGLSREQAQKIDALEKCEASFKTIHTHLQQRAILSPLFTILHGAQNGISAYGAILSFAFSTSIICMLVGGTISPVFVIGCIASGIPCLLVSVLASWYQHRPDRRTQIIDDNQIVINSLHSFIQRVKYNPQVLTERARLEAGRDIEKAIPPQEPTVRLIAYVMEMFRSFFSAIGKGKKETDFFLNGFQEPDHLGHVQDTACMMPFICAFSVLNCLVFTLRAYAKYFGNEKTIQEPVIVEPPPSILNGANRLFSQNTTHHSNGNLANNRTSTRVNTCNIENVDRPQTPMPGSIVIQPGCIAVGLTPHHYTF